MKINESAENYLETILVLKNKNGYVRSIDIAHACASFYPTCCAISPDGRTVAVGVGDRLSCVYIYTNPYFK